MNIAMLVDMAADALGERPAFGRGEGVGFDALRERIRRRAGAIARHATESGIRHVVFLGVTGPVFVENLFAAAWAGVPFVPVNYRLRTDELEQLVAPLRPALVLHDPELADKAVACTGARDVSATTLQIGDELLDTYPIEPDAVAVLLYTSGTTSAPKAVVLRHRHLCSYVFGTIELGGAGADETVLMTVPPYHIAGVAGALTTTYVGRRTVHLPQFDGRAWLQLARAERVSHAFVVPTMLARITQALEQNPSLRPPALRHLSYGGGPAHYALVRRALAAFGRDVDFVNAYGLTETSSTVAVLSPQDHRNAVASDDPDARRRLASVGRPLPGVDVAVLDADRAPLPAGQTGEIAIRGDQVTGEYRSGVQRTTPEGYFRTGDLGYLDEDGFLFLVGRMDDMIIRGGENISPVEIEEVLLDHPAVADAAVVGVPDQEWGTQVGAAVVVEPGQALAADELREWARERLSSYKVPVRVRVVDELPRTTTGKLLRRLLVDVVAEDPSVGVG